MAAILRWMFVLVLLIAVAGGGAAYWLYIRSDEGLRLEVLRQLSAMAPNVKFEIGRAHLDFIGRVRIYGLTAQLPDDDDEKPSFEIPEIVATLEPTQLTNFENVVVQKLRIVNPKIRAVRGPDRNWNLQRIELQPVSGGPIPDVEVEHGSILVEIQLPDRASRQLKFQNFNVSTSPKDSRRLAVKVATLLEPAGPLTLEIDVNLDGPTWECSSRDAWRVPVDVGLIQLLCDLSPDLAAPHIASAGQWIDRVKASQIAATPITTRPSSPMKLESRLQASSTPYDFGLSCVCDLTFQVGQDEPGCPLQFRALAFVKSGQINNELLPFPLHELQGKILVDNRQIIVSEVRASNGPTQFAFDGDVVPSKPIQASLKIRGIELDDELKSRLPEALRRFIQQLGLTGLCDADATVTLDSGVWQHEVDLRLGRGTVTHERFPVTVRNVEGELHLRKNVVTFDANGKYAGRPVIAHGTITNPGPAHQADIVLTCNNLPLDDESVAACPLPIRKTIEALKLRGRHDVLLRLTRPAGFGQGQKYEPELIEKLYDGSLCFTGFPLEIQQLQGFVKWTGDVVTFTELAGMHDGAKVTGHGTFRRIPSPGRLDLTIDASDATFDRSLHAALPATLRQVWKDFQPQGNFDIKTNIAWVPGEPCEVKIPRVIVRNGAVLMKCFPWPLQKLKGEFSFNMEPGKLDMKVSARHDDTQLSASGVGWFRGKDPWRLKFDQLNIDDLDPNENTTFRNALPLGIQRVFDVLRPAGIFSFDGPVEFYGPQIGGDSISARWDLRTVLSRCAINAGIQIDEMNGVVQLKGQWDGSRTDLDGELKLDSVSVFRLPSGRSYQITQVSGPISFHDGKFVAGMEAAIPPRRLDPDKSNRIRGEAIDGTLYLDAAVDLRAEPEYRAFIELEKGRLERYAQQYLRGQSNLAGVMNGWMNLHGNGTSAERMVGEGKLRIAPAALYELPLFVQMFRIPQLRVPDSTAFEQADLSFTVGDGRFDFKSIELLGDAMSLRGRGYIRLDGGMQLEFGSRPGRGPRRLIQNLFMGPEWIAVRVTGNVGDPKTTIVPLPELDDAMKQFFNPRQMSPSPARFPARTGQNPSGPIK